MCACAPAGGLVRVAVTSQSYSESYSPHVSTARLRGLSGSWGRGEVGHTLPLLGHTQLRRDLAWTV